MANDPKPAVLPAPAPPEGEPYNEVALAYPGDHQLTFGNYRNGVRIRWEGPPRRVDDATTGDEGASAGTPQPDRPLLSDVLVPWEAWYKIRPNMMRRQEKRD